MPAAPNRNREMKYIVALCIQFPVATNQFLRTYTRGSTGPFSNMRVSIHSEARTAHLFVAVIFRLRPNTRHLSFIVLECRSRTLPCGRRGGRCWLNFFVSSRFHCRRFRRCTRRRRVSVIIQDLPLFIDECLYYLCRKSSC